MDKQDPPPPPSPVATHRKHKFKPRASPLPPNPLPSLPLSEEDAADKEAREAADAKRLLNKFNANLRRGAPKEKKLPPQVAFGLPTTSLRTYGNRRVDNTGISGKDSHTRHPHDIDNKLLFYSPSTVKSDETTSSDAYDALSQKIKKDYKEPWDYNKNYPISLPLRRPYSGDPGILNEIEFGTGATKLGTDENSLNAASVLGLLEESEIPKMFLFQLPTKLPLATRLASAKGKEKAESSVPLESKRSSEKCVRLEELPQGHMGKMLIYKNGAVKLKIGDVLYDVSPGTDRTFTEDVMAVNTTAKHCCCVGQIEKHAVVTPDVDSLLDSVIKLD